MVAGTGPEGSSDSWLEAVEEGSEKTNPSAAPKNAGHSKHAKRSGAGHPEAGQWVLPLFGYGYVPVIFGLLLTIQDVGFARYELFVNSGLALIFLLPLYAIILAKLAINRGNEGRKSVGLSLFQFVSLVPLVLWLLFVLTFGGSPA